MRIIISETQLELISEQLDINQFKKAIDLTASQWYWDHIRDEEGLKCKAYNIGDGKWTIGYGHTEGVKEGDVLCEATSGNSGISFAMLAAERGYKMVIIMPSNMSEERKNMFRHYGAELIEVGEGDFDGAI